MTGITLEVVEISDEQKSVIELVKKLIDSLAEEVDREMLISMGNKFFKEHEIPSEIFTLMGPVTSSGLLEKFGLEGAVEGFLGGGGAPTPPREGGMALGVDDMRAFMTELVKIYSKEIGEGIKGGLSDLSETFNVGALGVTALAVNGILGHGSAGMKKKYLPELLKGNLMSFAVTEPDAGTNTFNISTTAVREGDYYRVNGQKVFITGALGATLFYTAVKVIEDGEDMGINYILIDGEDKGVDVSPMDMEVFPGEEQCSVFFDDVMVPKEDLVGGKRLDKKKKKARSESFFFALNFERLLVGMGGIALGNIILDIATEHAKQKKISGEYLGKYQTIKHKLSRLRIRLELANMAAHKGAALYDNKGDPEIVGMYANMVKLLGSEISTEACELAIQIHGADGLSIDSQLYMLLQGARVIRILPINNEMCLNYIGEHSLNLPKSYR